MDDLIAFLIARFDEDAQMARESGNRRWLVQDNIIELHPEHEDDGFMSWPTRADARHAANWEPARVLREVDAKRWIVGEILAACMAGRLDLARGIYGRTLRLLALPYNDHPDYREEWKPWPTGVDAKTGAAKNPCDLLAELTSESVEAGTYDESADWFEDPPVEVIHPTSEEYQQAAQLALDELGCTMDELADMAARGDYPTPAHRRVWLAIKPAQ